MNQDTLLNKISIKAHPQQIVTAYERLLQKETVNRGVSYNLDVVEAMGHEIQCLRREKNEFVEEQKLLKVEVRKKEAEIRSLKRELD